MYSLLIHFYAFIVALIAPFHKKARTMRLGQWNTNQILRSQIKAGEKYIWFHAASLGEFEQGRPMIELIKSQHPQYKILLTFFSPSGYEVRKTTKGQTWYVICHLTLLIGYTNSWTWPIQWQQSSSNMNFGVII